MPFDINARGNVDLTPLVSYEAAVIAETGCCLRLVFARPDDQRGTGSIIVQTALTIEQAQELAGDLQRMIDRIFKTPMAGPAH